MLRKKLLLFAILFLCPSLWANETCLKCHGKAESKLKAAFVDINIISASVHAELDCNDCHNINPKKKHKGFEDIQCGSCHTDEEASYAQSPHMKGRDISIDDIPKCYSCHGGHDIVPVNDLRSKTNHINSVKICTGCHEDEALPEKFDVLPEPTMIIAYEKSIHGWALLVDGNIEAPACVDCHGSHSFLPSDQIDSPLNKIHIAETCGKCHAEISLEYNESVHGHALSDGITESPTCTDCHGEHNIQTHLDPESKVYATNIPKTCSECHTSEKVIGKFGLKPDRIETFKESFHGIAVELGETTTANCASCHGIHNIYPKSDSRSMIHKDNVVVTCGQCHEDLPEDFAQGEVHTTATSKESGGKYYVRNFYIYFITIIILGFVVYRILEYKRRVKRVE
jgi:hypothetical protein